MIDLDDLEKKARAASPGPWYMEKLRYIPVIKTRNPRHYCKHIGGPKKVRIAQVGSGSNSYGDWPDADYIAAMSPDVCLQLIAELRALRGIESIASYWEGYAKGVETRLKDLRDGLQADLV